MIWATIMLIAGATAIRMADKKWDDHTMLVGWVLLATGLALVVRAW